MLEESEINDLDHGSTQTVGRQEEQVGPNPRKTEVFEYITWPVLSKQL